VVRPDRHPRLRSGCGSFRAEKNSADLTGWCPARARHTSPGQARRGRRPGQRAGLIGDGEAGALKPRQSQGERMRARGGGCCTSSQRRGRRLLRADARTFPPPSSSHCAHCSSRVLPKDKGQWDASRLALGRKDSVRQAAIVLPRLVAQPVRRPSTTRQTSVRLYAARGRHRGPSPSGEGRVMRKDAKRGDEGQYLRQGVT
jgi:hypothetical protein